MFALLMRPEDFKYPFKEKLEQCAFVDGIIFLPLQKEGDNELQILDFFAEKKPLHVEYCSGNGAWIADKALESPQWNWIGVEKKFDRARKIWAKMKNRSLKNLLVICGEAHLATRLLFPSCSLDQAYINFPDPWPKTRHWKHRLISPPFLEELHRAVIPGGGFTFVTDDIPYSEATMKEVKKQDKFAFRAPDPGYVLELPSYGSSYFEELWRSQGKQVRYHQFIK
jgi:tRNA (guanine-N7-)-methyltransferase